MSKVVKITDNPTIVNEALFSFIFFCFTCSQWILKSYSLEAESNKVWAITQGCVGNICKLIGKKFQNFSCLFVGGRELGVVVELYLSMIIYLFSLFLFHFFLFFASFK